MNALFGKPFTSDGHRQDAHSYSRSQRHWRWSLILVVLIPTIIATIYFGIIASPRYISEARIIIEADDNASAANALTSMLSSVSGLTNAGAALGQAHLLVEYLQSAPLLQDLQNEINIAQMYSRDEVDIISRLKSNPTREEFLDYFKSMMEIELDPTSRILTLRVEAFTPADAKLIMQSLLVFSEEQLNKISVRKQNDIIAFARREVNLAEERLKKARIALSEFRRQNADIDPARSAQAQGGLIADLSAQLATARAELNSSLVFLKPESTQIKALQARVEALERQIIDEQSRLVAGAAGTINARLARYEELLFEHEFAQTAYTSALAFVESSRVSSQKQRNYVVDFVEPNLPEEAVRPERIKSILTVLIVSFLIWGIGTLLFGAIRENSHV